TARTAAGFPAREGRPMTAADVLLKAASLVEEGWCQGHFGVHLGGKVLRCAAGAIIVVAQDDEDSGEAALACIEREVGNVASWNDTPGRTAAEVAAAMRRAALRGAE